MLETIGIFTFKIMWRALQLFLHWILMCWYNDDSVFLPTSGIISYMWGLGWNLRCFLICYFQYCYWHIETSQKRDWTQCSDVDVTFHCFILRNEKNSFLENVDNKEYFLFLKLIFSALFKTWYSLNTVVSSHMLV